MWKKAKDCCKDSVFCIRARFGNQVVNVESKDARAQYLKLTKCKSQVNWPSELDGYSGNLQLPGCRKSTGHLLHNREDGSMYPLVPIHRAESGVS